MKKYDIFKSEGGYRVCGAVYLDEPILDLSPWFETTEEAEEAAKAMEFKDISGFCQMFFMDGIWGLYTPFDLENFTFFDDRATAQTRLIDYMVAHSSLDRDYIVQKIAEK